MSKPSKWARVWFLSLAMLGLNLSSAFAVELLHGQGLLWKIEGTTSRPSYLFGTIHSEDPRVLTLPLAVQTAFDKADIYVMEALLDESALQSMGAMLFDDGRTLQQVLSPSTYSKTVTAMNNYGMPEAAISLMKPWAAAVTLSMPKPQTGMVLDLVLLQQAQAQHKQSVGLETMAEQMAVLDKLSLPEQITMLEDTLRQLPSLEQTFVAMHSAYLRRDLAALWKISDAQMARGDKAVGKKIMEQLLDKRNRRMRDRMLPYLKQGNAFIAIGALHLPGLQGVLKLLTEQGYRVSVVY